MKGHFSRERLNQFVLDIEFLLISIIQGLALAVLAGEAVTPISQLQFEYWPYILTAFLTILTFWSQAIIHALSFVKWPINITHSFLYFLVSFVEVMTFYHIKNPQEWYIFTFLFFMVVTVLYFFDLRMIKASKEHFTSPKEMKLYEHIYRGQLFDMKTLLPAALVFNAASFVLIKLYPSAFLNNNMHVIIGSLQALFTFLFLANSLFSFRKRTQLITQIF